MKQDKKQVEKADIAYYRERCKKLSHELALEKKNARQSIDELLLSVNAILEQIAIDYGERVYDDEDTKKVIGYRMTISKPSIKTGNAVKVERKQDKFTIGVVTDGNGKL